MKISINTNEVLYRARSKSHTETAQMTDPKLRYTVEAGSDKSDALKMALVQAVSSLCGELHRYLLNGAVMDASFADYTKEGELQLGEAYTFEFRTAERRFAGKEQAIADAVASYLVDQTLASYYRAAGGWELAERDALTAENWRLKILGLIQRKGQPDLPVV